MTDREIVLTWTDDSGSDDMSLQDIASYAANGDEKYRKILEYFRAQLDLFSKMFFYRQYLGISEIKKQLPIHLVLKYYQFIVLYCMTQIFY